MVLLTIYNLLRVLSYGIYSGWINFMLHKWIVECYFNFRNFLLDFCLSLLSEVFWVPVGMTVVIVVLLLSLNYCIK